MAVAYTTIQIPQNLMHYELPPVVHKRLHDLLDQQDQGITLTVEERNEADGLVELAEFLSLLRLRSERAVLES